MEAKEILSQLKQVFNSLVAPQPAPIPAPVAMGAEYKLKDGTEVMIDNLAPGGLVTIEGAPAPAGEHVLEDGTMIVLAEGGIISEVKPANMPAPEMAPVIPTPSMAQFEKLVNEFAEYKRMTNEAFAQTIKFMEELAKEPTADPDPVIPKKVAFKKEDKPLLHEQLADFSKTLFSQKVKTK